MKHSLRIVFLITTVAVLLAVSLVQASPRLTLPEVSFNFGFVPQHSTISHKFWLISSGEDTLRIIKVVPG